MCLSQPVHAYTLRPPSDRIVNPKEEYAAVIIWIMMSVKLVICQWEVENASCQHHLLTGEQQTGEKKEKRNTIYTGTMSNEYWI